MSRTNRETAAAAAAAPPLLSLRGITKSFFGVPVLKGIDLDCHPGEVHAIVGENGAGKSTLMKVIVGAHQPDAGTITVEGQQVSFHHPAQAQARGIGIVYQEFNLLLDRTVAQNIYLGREPRKGPLVDTHQMNVWTREVFERLHVGGSISPRALVRDLSVAQQQMVEIAKTLSLGEGGSGATAGGRGSEDARILIMDEPTASLSPPEAEALFERIRSLREQGFVVLYISHRLNEVFDLSDRITVIKDGAKVATVKTAETTPGDLVRMMVGRELSHYFPDKATPDEVGETRLKVTGGGVGMLHDIDLELRSGEIVGIAGLEGSGRTELAQALFGVRPFTTGTLEIGGKPVRIRSPRQAIDAGLGFITEDRKGEGLVLVRSVTDNGALALRSLPGRVRQRRGIKGAAVDIVTNLTRRVELRARNLDTEVQFLSGGNQQKVVLTKWLATEADILIFDEPTRGIDVGAKAGIHELMRELARAGVAILMISSELPEVIGMSDRIFVMRGGTLAGELPAEPSESDIMLLATGQDETPETKAS